MTNELQKVKDDLIAEIDKRIVDKIIEKTNADLLKKLIEQAETINEAIMIAELGTTYKRTGFHFDKRLEKMTDTVKYFKKNKKLSFVQDKKSPTHKLIIGDNYDALLNLLIEYHGKIDVIYIDPPYGKDSMGEFAKTNYENAITRDNLLSMLYPRLVLARQLLSDNGVIFCSIDDKNQAYVKGLFDEVFEESNFVSNIVWDKKASAKGVPPKNMLVNVHEYILAYQGKNGFSFSGIERNEDDGFKNPDNDPRGPWRESNIKSTTKSIDQAFSIVDPNTGREYTNTWAFSKKSLEQMIKENRILWKDTLPKQKEFMFEMTNENKAIKSSWGIFDAQSTTVFLKNLLPEVNFANPKPISLMLHLLSVATTKNSLILDFFAGSGTTGQAVLELNKQDGGKRQFILATANEITDTTPNGIVNDVTSKRLKRVMTGECYDGTKDFKWNEENKPLGDNLDVYDIATVAPYSDEPFTQIDETLYGKEKLGVNEKIKWVCENFESTQKTLKDK
ncbi:MAG: site-specific DNA-methyltransferase [Candidatus Parcubacteria bacterium]|nr:site-specific DNA-methyltransferase [Candidatus Parcubacteria bacterium]